MYGIGKDHHSFPEKPRLMVGPPPRMLYPFAHDEIFPWYMDYVGITIGDGLDQQLLQRNRYQLVGINQQNPVACRLFYCELSGRFHVPQSVEIEYFIRIVPRDPDSIVFAMHINDDDFIAPRERLKTLPNVMLFVEGIDNR
jgi:hypothetical protein